MRHALTTLAVAILLLGFAAIGIAHIFKPDYFIKHSGVRRGGDLLNRWNRANFQIVGAIFAGFAIYLLYILFRG